MSETMARDWAAQLVRDGYRNPRARVTYVYCTGRYAVLVDTDDECCVLLDNAAANVYRTTHRPDEGSGEHGAQQGQD